MTGPDMGACFVAALPRIRRILAKYPPPIVAIVAPDGAIRTLMTDKAIRAWLWEKRGIKI
jgi:hypothetical protein